MRIRVYFYCTNSIRALHAILHNTAFPCVALVSIVPLWFFASAYAFNVPIF
jgi:hypothetical protein